MKETIKYKGNIVIEPKLITNKHISQSEWKRTSMVMLGSDISDYYAWFIKKRYSLTLAKPIRQAHITFINDKLSDFNVSDPDYHLNLLKEKYDGLEVEIELNLNPRTNINATHWFLDVTYDTSILLQNIRNEVYLTRPYFDFHLTIGRVGDKDLEHSKYIKRLLDKRLI